MLKLLQYCNYIIIVMQIKLMLLLLLTQGGAIFKATVGLLHEFTGLTVEHSQLPEEKCPRNPWRVGDGYA